MSKIALLAAGILAPFVNVNLAAIAQQKPVYRVRAEYKLEGAGAAGNLWLDAASRRLYVARANRVDVLNADSGSREGSMPAQGAAGIVLVDGASRGFFANRAGGSVSEFNPAASSVIKSVALDAKGPESLAYDADAQKVFVVAPDSNEVVALDARTGEVAGRVILKGHLRQAISNGMGSLFVAAEDLNAIHVVDTHSLKFLGDIPSGDAEGPVSLAIDPSGRRLFAACADGKLAVIDTDIGFTFEELDIGTGDAGSVFTFTPQGNGGWKGADFVASADGKLTLVQMNAFIRYSVGGGVSIPKGIDHVVYDPQTHRVFLSQSTPSPEVLVLAPGAAEVSR